MHKENGPVLPPTLVNDNSVSFMGTIHLEQGCFKRKNLPTDHLHSGLTSNAISVLAGVTKGIILGFILQVNQMSQFRCNPGDYLMSLEEPKVNLSCGGICFSSMHLTRKRFLAMQWILPER